MDLKEYIELIPNFPKEGVIFRDITPLMLNGQAYRFATDEFVKFGKLLKAEVIVGPEARGFVFGCPVANFLNIGFVPVRKPGKLPRETKDVSYDLEYGENKLSIHKDSITPGQKVLIIDDLLATGGTIEATVKLVEALGGIIVGIGFLIELSELAGRNKIIKYETLSLVKY